MTNLQDALSSITTQLTNELNIPLIITFSVLDVLEKNGDNLKEAETLEYLQVLQTSITEVTQSLDKAIKEIQIGHSL